MDIFHIFDRDILDIQCFFLFAVYNGICNHWCMIFGSATKKDTVYPTMSPCDLEHDDQPEDSGVPCLTDPHQRQLSQCQVVKLVRTITLASSLWYTSFW